MASVSLCLTRFPSYMEFNVIVKHKNDILSYKIRKDRPGIYHADLDYSGGENESRPPAAITLIRGIRHWTGDYHDQFFLNRLGEVIEEHITRFA